MHLKLTLLALIILLPACGRRSDHEVLTDAHHDYQLFDSRYIGVLNALNQDNGDAVTEAVRLVGNDYQLSFGQSLWTSFIGDDHLSNSEGSPLHRAIYLVQKDIATLAKHAQNLERRVLFTMPLYEKINQLRCALCEAVRMAQAQKAYTQESQFIESRRLQKAQLFATHHQTALLANMANNQRPSTQKVTVTKQKIVVIA